MTKEKHATREAWLNECAERFNNTLFMGAMPSQFRITCGWPTRGIRGRKIVLGQCFSPLNSSDETTEITITMGLDDPLEVAAVLIHEMVHAVVGVEAGHGKEFGKLARSVGLTGKLTATTIGDGLRERIAPVLEKLGKYPHAKLHPGDGKKKQSTRLIKCECEQCGYNVRITRKWLDEIGAPHCPLHGGMEEC